MPRSFRPAIHSIDRPAERDSSFRIVQIKVCCCLRAGFPACTSGSSAVVTRSPEERGRRAVPAVDAVDAPVTEHDFGVHQGKAEEDGSAATSESLRNESVS